jgi:2-desacetyl-2-hydroxyethyl bacteriochlorophyllide A dehydrogenase
MTNFTAPTTTKCLIATAVNTVEIKERKLEALAAGQVRVKTEYSMVSTGTELHRIQATHTANRPFPTATGYIAIGTVVGLGEGVTAWRLGDRVLAGTGHHGMMDTPAERCTAVPDGVASRDAVCTPLLSISIRGVRAAKLALGDSAAIFGQGVIGVFATHLARLAGACPVIAVDPVAARRDTARTMGADATIDPLQEDVAARIRSLTDGRGVSAAIEATATPRVAASLPSHVRDEGRIVILGGVHGKVEMDLYTHFQKSNQTMVGTGSAFHADYPFDTDAANYAAILHLMRAGRIRPAPAITHCVPYTEGPAVYRLLIAEKDKANGVQFEWASCSANP